MFLEELPDEPQLVGTHLAALESEGHEWEDAGREKRSPAKKKKILRRPIPAGARDAFDPVDQELELFRAQGAAGALAGNPGERPAFQSFVVKHETRSIPKEDLQAVAAASDIRHTDLVPSSSNTSGTRSTVDGCR